MPTPELAAAFQATTYRVLADGEAFDLRLGEANPAFSRWLKRRGTACWGIVTACNPGGRLTLDENPARHAMLREKIAADGWPYVTARNVADAGDWPDEAGFCVLGMDKSALLALGIEFGQAAIVYGGSDGAGGLVWSPDFQA